MLVIAHRGAKGYICENTLPAFQKALELGAAGIELDVRLSADGEIFVFHDQNTERLTQHHGEFEEMSTGQIRALQLEGLFPIPTLTEVLDLIDKSCLINIELKNKNTAGPVHKLVEEYVSAQGWSYDNFLVSSFDWTALQEIRESNPKIPIGVLTATDLHLAVAFAKFVKAETIHPYYHLLTVENVLDMQQQGFGVYAWTINVPEDIEKIKSYRVNAIITDFPDKI